MVYRELRCLIRARLRKAAWSVYSMESLSRLLVAATIVDVLGVRFFTTVSALIPFFRNVRASDPYELRQAQIEAPLKQVAKAFAAPAKIGIVARG